MSIADKLSEKLSSFEKYNNKELYVQAQLIWVLHNWKDNFLEQLAS